MIWRTAVSPQRATETEAQVGNAGMAPGPRQESDGATGLPERRVFALRLEEEMARCRRSGRPLSVAILGLEEFPGPSGADQTLREVMEILRRSSRMVDMICRYDSDALAVLLAETTPEGVRTYAEGLVGLLATRSFGHGRRVTASVGASSFPDGAATSEDLMQGAAEALRAARQAGNSRVAVWAGARAGRRAESRVPLT